MSILFTIGGLGIWAVLRDAFLSTLEGCIGETHSYEVKVKVLPSTDLCADVASTIQPKKHYVLSSFCFIPVCSIKHPHLI
jgi:hypothetical protein